MTTLTKEQLRDAEYLFLSPTHLPKVIDSRQIELIQREMKRYREDDLSIYGRPEAGRKRMKRVFSPYLICKHPDLLRIMVDSCQSCLPSGFEPVFDIYFEIEDGDRGLPWHTGIDSTLFMKGRRQLVTLWISLVDVNETTGGRLDIFTDPPASFGMAVLNSVNFFNSARDGNYYSVFRRNLAGYLQRNFTSHDCGAGDAILFADTTFHRSEDIRMRGFQRSSYALRFVREDTEFDLAAVERLHEITRHYFYEILLNNRLRSFSEYRNFLAQNGTEIVAAHKMLMQ
ncbi:MAG: hypothetical protein WBV39_07025 [Rudaea sp.]